MSSPRNPPDEKAASQVAPAGRAAPPRTTLAQAQAPEHNHIEALMKTIRDFNLSDRYDEQQQKQRVEYLAQAIKQISNYFNSHWMEINNKSMSADDLLPCFIELLPKDTNANVTAKKMNAILEWYDGVNEKDGEIYYCLTTMSIATQFISENATHPAKLKNDDKVIETVAAAKPDINLLPDCQQQLNELDKEFKLLDWLKQCVDQLTSDYKKSGHTSHKKDVSDLSNIVGKLYASPDLPVEQKIRQIFAALYTSYTAKNKPHDIYKAGLFTSRSADSLESHLNAADQHKKHHFTRQVGLILKDLLKTDLSKGMDPKVKDNLPKLNNPYPDFPPVPPFAAAHDHYVSSKPTG